MVMGMMVIPLMRRYRCSFWSSSFSVSVARSMHKGQEIVCQSSDGSMVFLHESLGLHGLLGLRRLVEAVSDVDRHPLSPDLEMAMNPSIKTRLIDERRLTTMMLMTMMKFLLVDLSSLDYGVGVVSMDHLGSIQPELFVVLRRRRHCRHRRTGLRKMMTL